MADEQTTTPEKKGYGKRPLWQWVVIYLIIGGLVYAAVYYFFLSGSGAPSIPGY
ncbi:MAG: hypothetical protein NUV69_02925 [Candidatus Curtissbacteria bacterium]|nr:hypothetical protein [Candidatus Curtissbacteria bacterium]